MQQRSRGPPAPSCRPGGRFPYRNPPAPRQRAHFGGSRDGPAFLTPALAALNSISTQFQHRGNTC